MTAVMTSPSDSDLLTVDMVAEKLHVGKSTVWRLISGEGLRSVKIGKRRLVRVKDLDAWVSNRVEAEDGE